jgi:hypothetical protein
MRLWSMAVLLQVVLLTTACASNSGGPRVSVPDDAQMLLDMRRVEHAIEELVIDENSVGDDSAWSGVSLETMRPHELFVVAAHFFDDRPAWVLGTYDNNGGPDQPRARWTVGDSLLFIFQKVFYPNSYISNERPYLASKPAARRWMEGNQYDIKKLIEDFEADRR